MAGAGVVGSGQRLRAELLRCAPVLGIRLASDGSLPGRVFLSAHNTTADVADHGKAPSM
ncbi:hypothetical protein [Luedemannella flava]|uniref:hypothetical protein n=1 Tax=Luedemannella flava TaxID=349316 RepID=UPI0031DAACC9